MQIRNVDNSSSPGGQSEFLATVVTYVRQHTGRELGDYKASTLARQVEARMRQTFSFEPGDYLKLLKDSGSEAETLARTMLVSVTSFFRDPDAFAALATFLPKLFNGKSRADLLRVWTPACATGEEAFSIAMLLLEHANMLESAPRIQVFANDLDASAVATARSGLYSAKSTARIAEPLLRRFFAEEPGGFRVRRELREAVLFSVHDLITDPGFVRMDLVTCRNLMIYLNAPAQIRMEKMFHSALVGGGFLFLGAAEEINDPSLFESGDRLHRIYQKARHATVGRRISTGGSRVKSKTWRTYVKRTTEELTSTREELQSMNEELSVINDQLSTKLDELARAHDDLKNLMDATDLPIVFVDDEILIVRYTPRAVEFFSLLPCDIGRPLANLRTSVQESTLLDDVRRVISAGEPITKEVRDEKGRWFLARVVPYWEDRRRMGGAILTFVDISYRTLTERSLMLEKKALHAALDERSLRESLGALVEACTEQFGPDARAAFFLADEKGTSLYHCVGMSSEYARFADGLRIGPESLACGLAAHTGRAVLTADVTRDPLWKPWLWLARQFDYRGCWSFPVNTGAGRFVGTFTVYWKQPREATQTEQDTVSILVEIAGVIIARETERSRRQKAEQALHASEERLRALVDRGVGPHCSDVL